MRASEASVVGPARNRFDAVVVDEAQDLADADWTLVVALAAERPLWAFMGEAQGPSPVNNNAQRTFISAKTGARRPRSRLTQARRRGRAPSRSRAFGYLPFVLALATGVIVAGVTARSVRWYLVVLLSFAGAVLMVVVLMFFRVVSWSRNHPLLAEMFKLQHRSM